MVHKSRKQTIMGGNVGRLRRISDELYCAWKAMRSFDLPDCSELGLESSIVVEETMMQCSVRMGFTADKVQGYDNTPIRTLG